MKVVEDHIKNVNIKKGSDKQAATDEAVMQAFTNQLKVTKARNKFANISSEYSKKIGSTSLGAGDLIKEMFKLYLSKEIERKINYPE